MNHRTFAREVGFTTSWHSADATCVEALLAPADAPLRIAEAKKTLAGA